MGSIAILDIEQLRASLSSSASIITTDSELYQQSITRWASNAERPASIVIFPASVDDISQAVIFAAASGLEVATVGGRHSASGASSRDNGICIDLGGCRWGDVDTALAKHELATVGGTVNDTGIGGLTLGGGYGHLTGQYGMVIDNLLEVELVLVDGSVKKCSESTNPDLFWALRGAGVNFGVATSFTYQAYEQKNSVWAGTIIFTPDKLEAIFDVSNHLLETGDGRNTFIIGYAAPPPAFQPVILALVFFNGTEEEGKSFFEPLLNLGPIVNTMSSMPYAKVNSLLNGMLGPGLRRLMKGSSTLAPLPSTLARELFHDFDHFMKEVPNATGSILSFEYFSYEKLMEVPQIATAFANRGKTVGMVFCPGWTNEGNDTACREWTRAMSAKTRAYRLQQMVAMEVDDTTKTTVGEYSNHDGLGAGPEVLYGVNYRRLVELKKTYDPENVFGNGPNSIIKGRK